MNILLFGITKDIVGSSTLSLSDSEGREIQTVKALKNHLKEKYPKLGELDTLAIAINSEYAQDNNTIQLGDEIALIPPVSGG